MDNVFESYADRCLLYVRGVEREEHHSRRVNLQTKISVAGNVLDVACSDVNQVLVQIWVNIGMCYSNTIPLC